MRFWAGGTHHPQGPRGPRGPGGRGVWVSSVCFLSSFSCGGYAAATQAPWPGWLAAGGQREATRRNLSDRLACTGQGVRPGSANGDLEVTIATGPRSRRPRL